MVISLIQIEVFLLILARVLGLFLEAPILSDNSISKSVKVAVVITFSFLLWFVVPFEARLLPNDMVLFMIAAINEFFIGFLLGLVIRFIFEGVEAAGDLMGAQMGLSVSAIFDPSTGQQTVITNKLLRWVMVILFLIVDGHHFMLSALAKSFNVLPMIHSWNISLAVAPVVGLGASIFAIGIQLSAPILLVIFLLDFAFGMISRVAPQVNVFMLGFQLKPPLGIFIFLLMIPLLLERVVWLISMMIEQLVTVLYYLR